MKNKLMTAKNGSCVAAFCEDKVTHASPVHVNGAGDTLVWFGTCEEHTASHGNDQAQLIEEVAGMLDATAAWINAAKS